MSAAAVLALAWAESQVIILGDTRGRKQYRSFCTQEQSLMFLYRLVRSASFGKSTSQKNVKPGGICRLVFLISLPKGRHIKLYRIFAIWPRVMLPLGLKLPSV